MSQAVSSKPEPKMDTEIEAELLRASVPPEVLKSRKISDRVDQIVNCLSGEWLFSRLRLSNGGSVILLRAFFVSVWVFLIVLPVSLGVKDILDPSRDWTKPDFHRLAEYLVHHFTWSAVVFGSVYTALYARFAAQWRYLADVYNKIKEAEVKYSTQIESQPHIAEWKAGFAEDAQELHLATKKIFAQVIRNWLQDPTVKKAFIAYTTGGEDRYAELMKSVLWAVKADKELSAELR
jgi:hypothetical protein